MRNYEIRFIQLLPPGFDVVVRFVFAVSCDNLHFSAFDFNKNNIAAANGGNTLRFIFQIEFDFGVIHSRDCLFKAFVKSLAVYGLCQKIAPRPNPLPRPNNDCRRLCKSKLCRDFSLKAACRG